MSGRNDNMSTQDNQPISKDDPVLTAYVLGELEGAELARVEAALARDAALRVSVEEIRVTCGAITEALTSEVRVPVAVGGGAAMAEEAEESFAELARALRPQSDGARQGKSAGKARHGEARPRRRSVLLEYPNLYFVVGGMAAACFALVIVLNREVDERGLGGERIVRAEFRADPALAPVPSQASGQTVVSESAQEAQGPEMRQVPAVDATRQHPAVVAATTTGASASVGSSSSEGEEVISLSPFAVQAVDSSSSGEIAVPAEKVRPGVSRTSVAQTVGSSAAQLASDPTGKADHYEAASTQARPRGAWATRQLAQSAFSAQPQPEVFSGFGGGSSQRLFEAGDPAVDRDFIAVRIRPRSELGVQVETGSYARVRRALMAGHKPAREAVRIEQLLNAFSFAVPPVDSSLPGAASLKDAAVATQVEYAPAPWNTDHLLVRVSVQGRPQVALSRGAERLLVLVDEDLSPDRGRMLAEALRGLTARLRAGDHLVLLRGSEAGELLCSAEVGRDRWVLQDAIESLSEGRGVAAGLSSSAFAAELSKATRIVLCTAGQPVVPAPLARNTTPLSVLTLGSGALAPQALVALSGREHFRSDRAESVGRAREALLAQAGEAVPVVARRVALEAEFNRELVGEYRILGYEGEAGAYAAAVPADLPSGQGFTALYELVPTAAARRSAAEARQGGAPEALLTLRVRYDDAQRGVACRQAYKVLNGEASWERASDDFRFAAAVAAFGMVMRESPHQGASSLELVARLAGGKQTSVPAAQREDFLRLVERARRVF